MDNGDDGNTRALLFVDQIDHDRAIGGIQRSRRLVEQQDRPIGNEAVRDIDPMPVACFLQLAPRARRLQPRDAALFWIHGRLSALRDLLCPVTR
jgi:hypothetical protein